MNNILMMVVLKNAGPIGVLMSREESASLISKWTNKSLGYTWRVSVNGYATVIKIEDVVALVEQPYPPPTPPNQQQAPAPVQYPPYHSPNLSGRN
jgi:hypothetical protein